MQKKNYWARRLSRRRILAGSAAGGLGLAGLALAGCGDDDKGGGEATTAPLATITPRPTAADAPGINKDGVLKSRQGAPFASINPYKGLDSGLLWGFTIFDHLFYTPLDTGVRENFLAASIEQPDPQKIVIKMGDSVFHNKPPASGRAVKAQDAKASFESAAKQTAISNSSWWTQVLDKVEALDEKTLNITLKQVDAWTFSPTNFGSPIAGSILPEEIAKDPSFMDKELVGSGRYEFVSHQNGTNFKLKRFDNWRIKGEPWLAGIDYRLIQEQALALAAFSAKEIDSVVPNNKLERDQLVQKHGKDIEVDTDISRSVWTLLQRGDGQWKDPRVAQAMSLALDRKEFIQLMNFGDGNKTGPVPPSFTSQALTEKEIEDGYGKFDPAQAKQLLGASGFDASKEYSIKYITPGDRNAQFPQIVQSQLQKNLGLKIKLIGEDLGKWLQQSVYGSDYDGFVTYASLAYDDPSSYVGGYAKIVGGRQNSARWFDDEMDSLVLKQRTILDDKERNKAVHDIQLKAWEKGAPLIPVFVAITNTCTWAYVKGRVTGRGSYGLFNGRAYIDKS